MYKITCCRTSKNVNRRNINEKGTFIKSFNTLSEFVKFFINSNYNLFFPKIKEELTNNERKLFLIKVDSLLKSKL